MERINLKQLKEALMKFEDKHLENSFISHCMGLEEPENKIGLVFSGDEWEQSMESITENDKAYKILSKFESDLFEDAQKVFACQLCDDVANNFEDEFPESG